jgi:integrase
MAKKLTQIKVDQARPNPHKRREIPDAGKPGLYLVVQPSGHKSYAVRYRFRGEPRKLTLGFPSLATARRKAQEALDKLGEGIDPAAEKQAAKREAEAGSDLFAAIAEQFVQRHVRPNTRPSSAEQTERYLAKNVLPRWGKRHLQDLTKRDVLDLLDAVVDRGGGLSANRVLAAIRKLFNWAVERGIISVSPAAGVKPPKKEPSRDHYLTDDEVRWLWLACGKADYPFGALAKLLLLTGQRRTEVAGMTWAEIDFEKREWIIPGLRSKNGQPHSVPLSDAALDVIASLPRIESNQGFLFTTNARTHVTGYSHVKRALDEAMADIARAERGAEVEIPRWTFHDLRRTAATGMAKLGTPIHVNEAVLNHTAGKLSGVARIYNRHDYAPEKRKALQAWANFVVSLVEGRAENVLPLRA